MPTSQERNKCIFISGGASGIGMETAKRMLDHGWTVGCYDIVPVEWHQNEDIEEGQLITGHLDVRSWEDWENAMKDCTSHTGGRLDGFFNNAGVIIDGRLEDQDPERIQWILDINCVGVTYGAKAAHPYLDRTKDSVIVSMGSASAIYGQPEISTYSASKFYVKGLTEALSLEWAKNKIRVHSLAPLWAKTKVAEVNARSTRTLGVRLEPGDVADVAAKLFAEPSFYDKLRVHHGVSVPDKVLKTLADFSPDLMKRFSTKLLVG